MAVEAAGAIRWFFCGAVVVSAGVVWVSVAFAVAVNWAVKACSLLYRAA